MFIVIVVTIFSSATCFADNAVPEMGLFEWADYIPKLFRQQVFIEEEAFVAVDKLIWLQDFGKLRAMSGHFVVSVRQMRARYESDRKRYGKIYPRYFEVLSKYQSALEDRASNFHRISSELGKNSKELDYSFEDYAHDLNLYSNFRDDYREIRWLIKNLPIFICPWIWDTSLFSWIGHFQNVENQWASLESEWIATEERASFKWHNIMSTGIQNFSRLQNVTACLTILVKRMRIIDENAMAKYHNLPTNYFVVSSQYLLSLDHVISEMYRIMSELDRKSRDVTYYPLERHIEDMIYYNELKDRHRQTGKLMEISYRQYMSECRLK